MALCHPPARGPRASLLWPSRRSLPLRTLGAPPPAWSRAVLPRAVRPCSTCACVGRRRGKGRAGHATGRRRWGAAAGTAAVRLRHPPTQAVAGAAGGRGGALWGWGLQVLWRLGFCGLGNGMGIVLYDWAWLDPMGLMWTGGWFGPAGTRLVSWGFQLLLEVFSTLACTYSQH